MSFFEQGRLRTAMHSPVRYWLSIALLGMTAFPSTLCAAEPPAVEAAGAFVEEARALVAEREWARAATVYIQAYERLPNPILLWNAARCEETAGDLTSALALFEKLAAKHGPERHEGQSWKERVAAHLPTLREKISAETGGTPEPKAPESGVVIDSPAPAAPPMTPHAIAGWTTLGVGLAALATSAGLFAGADARYEEGHAASTPEQTRNLLGEGDALTIGGWVAAGVGGASALSGIILLILDATDVIDASQAWAEPAFYFGEGGRWLVGSTIRF